MADPALESYEEVLYPSYTHNQTHPDRLATLATLYGLEAAPVERCRVLDIGCGDGGNLLPMAFALPESEFVGIDLAGRPIAKGRAIAEALGLKNIELLRLDLMDVSEGLGQFDYIIAHGLYSWVGPQVQNKLLAVCRSNLKPQGIAYVSYNTFPGCHLRLMLREMMLFHVRHLAEPQQQINQAMALIKFMAGAQTQTDAYAAFLKEEFEQAVGFSAGHLYHDDLASINSPIYFHQFMDHAARHGLQFMAEADYYEMQDYIYPPEVSAVLSEMAARSIILKEQYLDFLKCRRFRQTLLCHQELKLDPIPKAERLMNLYMASPSRPASGKPNLNARTVEAFRGVREAKVATDYPLAKAALYRLGEIFPHSLHFTELLTQARGLTKTDEHESAALGNVEAQDKPEANDSEQNEAQDEAQALAEILLHTYASGMLELSVRAPDFVEEASERPVASPLARLQIRSDTVVTNMRHIGVEVEDALGRRLLLLLDGTRDRDALLKELAALVQSGEASLQQEGARVTDPQQVSEILSRGLEENLRKLAKLALLVA
ncbi:MAG TPA: class I SAM-dependent methyltransferase [Pyrinomonadaceae bacterium]|jgi:methyltransferase-like protein/2-polyprenyl-3-methyl-5-hydroxy-6-metoxy-1,4-benzoquinol methylase